MRYPFIVFGKAKHAETRKQSMVKVCRASQ